MFRKPLINSVDVLSGEFKVSAGGLQSLVSAGDVQDIAALYQDYLDDITPPKSALLGFRLQDVKNRTQRR